MSEFTGYGRNNDIDFGDYVKIKTGYSGDMHIYKVIKAFQTNFYCDAPIRVTSEPTLHDGITEALKVIHCGIDENKVITVRQDDCEIMEVK